MHLGKFTEARQAYNRGLALDPSSVPMLAGLRQVNDAERSSTYDLTYAID